MLYFLLQLQKAYTQARNQGVSPPWKNVLDLV